MSNDPAQDRYDPPGTGSDWEVETFDSLNEMDIFYFVAKLKDDNNLSWRKVNQDLARCIKTGEEKVMTPHQKIFVKN